MKSFINQIQELLKVLSTKESLKVRKHLIVLSLNVILDLFSVASILPLILMFSDQEAFSNSRYVIALSEFIDIPADQLKVPLVIGVFFFFCVKSLAAYWLYKKNAQLLAGISRRLSLDTFKQNFTIDEFPLQSSDSGKQLQRIIEIPEAYAYESLASFFKLFVSAITATLVSIILMAYQPLVFLLVLVILTPGIAIYLAMHKNKTTNIRNDISLSIPKVMQKGLQALNGRFEILLSGAEEFFESSFSKSSRKKNDAIAQLLTYTSSSPKIMELIAILGVCCLFTYLFISDTPSNEALLLLSVFTVATFRLIPSINKIILAKASIKVHGYAVKSLLQLHKEKPTLNNKPKANATLDKFEHSIQFFHLDFEYPDGNFRLEDLCFTLLKGTKFGLIGKSGSGKSTIAKLLLRFEQEIKGEILIDHKSIKDFDHKSLWSNIAYVPQNAFIFKGSLAQNITMGQVLTEPEKERLTKLVSNLGLEDLIDQSAKNLEMPLEEFGKSISTGQKQRIGIARAIWQDRPILIFDEVTANLDDISKQQVIDLLNKAMVGKTVLMITHDPTIVEMCDEVLDLNKIAGQ